ncbi:MAG: hypothetical protein WBE53_05115, partial [Pseudolabrys sp.]
GPVMSQENTERPRTQLSRGLSHTGSSLVMHHRVSIAAAGRGPTRHIRHFALTPQTLPRPTFVPGRVTIVAETRLNPLNVLG